ncbi:MAG: hypothetical protein QXD03_01860 [Candidatus Anstonellales archaeon]
MSFDIINTSLSTKTQDQAAIDALEKLRKALESNINTINKMEISIDKLISKVGNIINDYSSRSYDIIRSLENVSEDISNVYKIIVRSSGIESIPKYISGINSIKDISRVMASGIFGIVKITGDTLYAIRDAVISVHGMMKSNIASEMSFIDKISELDMAGDNFNVAEKVKDLVGYIIDSINIFKSIKDSIVRPYEYLETQGDMFMNVYDKFSELVESEISETRGIFKSEILGLQTPVRSQISSFRYWVLSYLKLSTSALYNIAKHFGIRYPFKYAPADITGVQIAYDIYGPGVYNQIRDVLSVFTTLGTTIGNFIPVLGPLISKASGIISAQITAIDRFRIAVYNLSDFMNKLIKGERMDRSNVIAFAVYNTIRRFLGSLAKTRETRIVEAMEKLKLARTPREKAEAFLGNVFPDKFLEMHKYLRDIRDIMAKIYDLDVETTDRQIKYFDPITMTLKTASEIEKGIRDLSEIISKYTKSTIQYEKIYHPIMSLLRMFGIDLADAMILKVRKYFDKWFGTLESEISPEKIFRAVYTQMVYPQTIELMENFREMNRYGLGIIERRVIGDIGIFKSISNTLKNINEEILSKKGESVIANKLSSMTSKLSQFLAKIDDKMVSIRDSLFEALPFLSFLKPNQTFIEYIEMLKAMNRDIDTLNKLVMEKTEEIDKIQLYVDFPSKIKIDKEKEPRPSIFDKIFEVLKTDVSIFLSEIYFKLSEHYDLVKSIKNIIEKDKSLSIVLDQPDLSKSISSLIEVQIESSKDLIKKVVSIESVLLDISSSVPESLNEIVYKIDSKDKNILKIIDIASEISFKLSDIKDSVYGYISVLYDKADEIVSSIRNVKRFSEGGIVKEPTFAVVGERVPEIIIPIDKIKQIDLPEFAEGGIVTKKIAAIVGDVKEAIIPLKDFPNIISEILKNIYSRFSLKKTDISQEIKEYKENIVKKKMMTAIDIIIQHLPSVTDLKNVSESILPKISSSIGKLTSTVKSLGIMKGLTSIIGGGLSLVSGFLISKVIPSVSRLFGLGAVSKIAKDFLSVIISSVKGLFSKVGGLIASIFSSFKLGPSLMSAVKLGVGRILSIVFGSIEIINDIADEIKRGGSFKDIIKNIFLGRRGLEGFENIVSMTSKYTLFGMAAGIPFGPIGVVVGSIFGSAIGVILGWIGRENLENIDIGKIFSNIIRHHIPSAITGAIFGLSIYGPIGFIVGGLIGFSVSAIYQYLIKSSSDKSVVAKVLSNVIDFMNREGITPAILGYIAGGPITAISAFIVSNAIHAVIDAIKGKPESERGIMSSLIANMFKDSPVITSLIVGGAFSLPLIGAYPYIAIGAVLMSLAIGLISKFFIEDIPGKIWNWLKKKSLEVIDSVKTIFGVVWDWLVSIKDKISDFISENPIAKTALSFAFPIFNVISIFKSIFEKMYLDLSDKLSYLKDFVLSSILGIKNRILEIFDPDRISNVISMISFPFGLITKSIESIYDTISKYDIFEEMKKGIISIWNIIKDKIGSVIDKIKSFFGIKTPEIIESEPEVVLSSPVKISIDGSAISEDIIDSINISPINVDLEPHATSMIGGGISLINDKLENIASVMESIENKYRSVYTSISDIPKPQIPENIDETINFIGDKTKDIASVMESIENKYRSIHDGPISSFNIDDFADDFADAIGDKFKTISDNLENRYISSDVETGKPKTTYNPYIDNYKIGEIISEIRKTDKKYGMITGEYVDRSVEDRIMAYPKNYVSEDLASKLIETIESSKKSKSEEEESRDREDERKESKQNIVLLDTGQKQNLNVSMTKPHTIEQTKIPVIDNIISNMFAENAVSIMEKLDEFPINPKMTLFL